MPNLQQKGNQYWICLPKELVEYKKWPKGKRLVLAFNERGNLEIRD
jgi:hypothetical protein